jgi:DNA-binding MarR family transcriptional regulator
MDRYTLTYEGRAKFRRMETRVTADTSARTGDYDILYYIYEYGAATVSEIEEYTGLPTNEAISRLAALMSYGYIEELP